MAFCNVHERRTDRSDLSEGVYLSADVPNAELNVIDRHRFDDKSNGRNRRAEFVSTKKLNNRRFSGVV